MCVTFQKSGAEWPRGPMQINSRQFKFARHLSVCVRESRGIFANMLWLKVAGLGCLAAFLHVYVGLGLLWTLSVVFATHLATGGWRFALVVVKTLPRDFRGLLALIKLNLKVQSHLHKKSTIAKLFQERVKKHPSKLCFIFEDQTWTYQQVEEHANRVANYFHDAGFRKGDVVSVFMENSPQTIFFWMGLSKIGVVSALINFNLRLETLAHSINAAESKALIFGGEMSEAVKDILQRLPVNMSLFCSGQMVSNDLMPTFLDPHLARASILPPPSVDLSFKDKLFYIYTSGTTGLPKAAIVTHARFFYMSYGVNQLFRISSQDIIYNTLPLYHTAGGILGVGQLLHSGVTMVIRRKFSASQFWLDCVKYNCTVAQYIGEICRYLLVQPFHPEEQQHRVRLMFGNGVKPQIWRQFQERFGVSLIGEFYGATEGNCSVVNFENKVGAVGFTTRIAPFLYPVTLLKVDPANGDIVRDKHGLCVHAKPGEVGEMAGKIVTGRPAREFDGYVQKSATDRKIIHDVFRKGDRAFLTGDLLMMDELGYLYFHDRTGDTFRWRGENVSTSEVEAIISNHAGLKDAVVYGVEVPGSEGRAGMAAIADENFNLDLNALTIAMQKSLPQYARPVFLRLMTSMDTTGTFKLMKTDLRKEAFDPNKIRDRLYYFNAVAGRYQPLTPSIYAGICNGTVRI